MFKKTKLLKDKSINIECPHCNKENDFPIGSGIQCEHCKKELTGVKYLKNGKMGVGVLVTWGCLVFGGHSAANILFDSNRYPIDTEYSIVESCLSSYSRPLQSNKFSRKKSICQSILKDTQKEFTYQEFKDNQRGFINAFEANYYQHYKK